MRTDMRVYPYVCILECVSTHTKYLVCVETCGYIGMCVYRYVCLHTPHILGMSLICAEQFYVKRHACI